MPVPAPALELLLRRMVKLNASDLHITGGRPPSLRVDGRLLPAEEEPLGGEDAHRLVTSMLSDAQRTRLNDCLDLDLAFGIKGLARFRANVFHHLSGLAAAIRRIPDRVPRLDTLGLPPALRRLIARSRGLVLVTGPTGSGKSTTLAALVDALNRERDGHIITIEDPIEFVHADRRSVVTQREIGEHVRSFGDALKFALRQDPDVILIGEMRDPETIAAALTMAETGHLVLATLHTNSGPESVNRIVDAFPGEERNRVKTQLAFVLQGVLTQLLIPRIRGGRVCAAELMVCTPAIRTVIREGKIHQIPSLMQAGSRQGMITMLEALRALCLRNEVEVGEAARHVDDPDGFARNLGDPWELT